MRSVRRDMFATRKGRKQRAQRRKPCTFWLNESLDDESEREFDPCKMA